MPSTDPIGCNLASTCTLTDTVTYDRPRSVGRRDKRTSRPRSHLPVKKPLGGRPGRSPSQRTPQGREGRSPLPRGGPHDGGRAAQRQARCPAALPPARPPRAARSGRAPRRVRYEAPTTAASRCTAAPLALLSEEPEDRGGEREARPPPPRRHGR